MLYGHYSSHNKDRQGLKGVSFMIMFDPLWRTMKKKGYTTYTLRVKYGISNSTVQRLKKNMPVSTNTLDELCKLLDCPLSDVARYVSE
jgi:DNA-binding Xre family transcriptional regulator